jgi:hypothetical protein
VPNGRVSHAQVAIDEGEGGATALNVHVDLEPVTHASYADEAKIQTYGNASMAILQCKATVESNIRNGRQEPAVCNTDCIQMSTFHTKRKAD